MLGELHDALQHRNVETQWRRRVDDREHRRFFADLLLAHAACDSHHLEHVTIALCAEAVAVDHLVAHREHVVGGLDVADGRVQVHRLDGIAGEKVDDVEHGRQLHEILEVLARAGVTRAIQLDEVGRARHTAECHPVATDTQVVLGVARVHRELAWTGLDRFHHERRVEAHACIGDLHAVLRQECPSVGFEEVDAVLREHAQGGQVDRFHLIVGEHARRPVGHPRLLERLLLWQARPRCARTLTTAPTSGACFCSAHNPSKQMAPRELPRAPRREVSCPCAF